jgi:receptor protein-tyrosine kinase
MGAILPDDSRSKIKEEYKHIKRPLLQKAMARMDASSADNLIMVTSAYSGEGKTFSSLNLALSIAVERDCRVLLIDADVVKPGLGRTLAMEDKPGLVEYLNGEVESLSEVLLTTNINNLTILPAGKTHHLSHELLASNSMRELAKELSSRYRDRIIIFDSPPVLITSEAKVLSDVVGQIAMVIEQDKTAQQSVKEALSKLDATKISGLILNKSHSLGAGYYGYYYND